MVGPALFDGPEVSLCFGAHQCLKINRGWPVVAITCDFCSDAIPGTTERPRYVKPEAESVGLQRRVETERKEKNVIL
jgi:hypothetical protein